MSRLTAVRPMTQGPKRHMEAPANITKDSTEIKRRLARPRSRELCRNPLIYVSSYFGLLV